MLHLCQLARSHTMYICLSMIMNSVVLVLFKKKEGLEASTYSNICESMMSCLFNQKN